MRFAREGGLVDLQVHGLEQPSIGRDTVARLQQHDVAGHQLDRAQLLHVPLAPHAHDRRLHGAQRRQRLLGLVFLEEPQGRVEHDNREDHNRVFGIADQDRDHGGHQQHDDHDFGELAEQDLPGRGATFAGEFIRAVLRPAAFDFLGAQPAGRIRFEALQHVLCG